MLGVSQFLISVMKSLYSGLTNTRVQQEIEQQEKPISLTKEQRGTVTCSRRTAQLSVLKLLLFEAY